MAINKDYRAVRYKTETQRGQVFEALKIFAFYFSLFVMLVLTVYYYAHLGRMIILNAVILMVLACLLSYWKVPTERPNQITAIKRNLFLYLGGLLLAYFAVSLMGNIDANQLGVSLGLNAGQTQANAAQGWVTMLVLFAVFSVPFASISYEMKRIWQYYGFGFGHVTKRKRMEQLQKTIVR